MKNHTLSISQMQQLKELGVELGDTLLYWARCKDNNPRAATHYGKWVLVKGNQQQTIGMMSWEFVPAFTLQDIIELLPKYIDIQDRYFYLEIVPLSCQDNRWVVAYENKKRIPAKRDDVFYYTCRESIMEAAYQMLCWCAGSGYLKGGEK